MVQTDRSGGWGVACRGVFGVVASLLFVRRGILVFGVERRLRLGPLRDQLLPPLPKGAVHGDQLRGPPAVRLERRGGRELVEFEEARDAGLPGREDGVDARVGVGEAELALDQLVAGPGVGQPDGELLQHGLEVARLGAGAAAGRQLAEPAQDVGGLAGPGDVADEVVQQLAGVGGAHAVADLEAAQQLEEARVDQGLDEEGPARGAAAVVGRHPVGSGPLHPHHAALDVVHAGVEVGVGAGGAALQQPVDAPGEVVVHVAAPAGAGRRAALVAHVLPLAGRGEGLPALEVLQVAEAHLVGPGPELEQPADHLDPAVDDGPPERRRVGLAVRALAPDAVDGAFVDRHVVLHHALDQLVAVPGAGDGVVDGQGPVPNPPGLGAAPLEVELLLRVPAVVADPLVVDDAQRHVRDGAAHAVGDGLVDHLLQQRLVGGRELVAVLPLLVGPLLLLLLLFPFLARSRSRRSAWYRGRRAGPLADGLLAGDLVGLPFVATSRLRHGLRRLLSSRRRGRFCQATLARDGRGLFWVLLGIFLGILLGVLLEIPGVRLGGLVEARLLARLGLLNGRGRRIIKASLYRSHCERMSLRFVQIGRLRKVDC
ncbi:uncharacterized protein PG986_006120 [Apiospora aurea]|uniref:Uncharacterized protein n=1 Tax=Apiospora aurea TaxID=335848 RepID=A0ABR1QJH8_9PEZI